MLSPRQELLLGLVIDGFAASGLPVGSKALAADPAVVCGPSTIRNELAVLEERGLLAHPHTSAGRVPTDAGHRYFVDRLLPGRPATRPALALELVSSQVGEAMRATTETLAEVTDLMAVVSAPPIDTATIRHVELLALQPHVLMTVIITSTGGVSKRVFTLDAPADSGLVAWAAAYLNERLTGTGLGARTLRSRLSDPGLDATEAAFIAGLAPAFTDLAESAQDTLYVDGTARLVSELRLGDMAQLRALMALLEHRVTVLELVSSALEQRGVVVRIGHEHRRPELRGLSLVAAGYGLPTRHLGTVSVLGPTRMDYGRATGYVRDAAGQLSRFFEDVYEAA